ncbi:MAG TPA: hypothetical protein VKF62_05600, partial [Planctomycetota bacterium]|nr:hypothetical protein [Planctomycetota bacterium]
MARRPAPPSRAPRRKSLAQRLEAAGQGHLLRHLETLGPSARKALLEEVEALDLGEIREALSRLQESAAPPATF